jgi:putative transposase
MMPLTRNVFKRLHYPVDIITLCVGGYLAYTLSLRNLDERVAERRVIVDQVTLQRWIIRLVPLLDKAFRRYKRPVRASMANGRDRHKNQRPMQISLPGR